MKHIFILISWCICLILHNTVSAISLVYNLKIRRSFVPNLRSPIFDNTKAKWVGSGVPIFYWRNRHIVDPLRAVNICEHKFTDGLILNLRYINPKSWWIEATTGIEKEHVRTRGTHPFCGAKHGLDDIVVAGGYNFHIAENGQFVLYGLAGFPTKWRVGLEEIQDPIIGTRFFSSGIGSEISYSFKHTQKHSFFLLFQNRFIHFYNRRYAPILPVDAKIQPGNVTDFLFTGQYRYKKNVIETGYNLTLFSNQAVLLPAQKIPSAPFIRHSCYATYARLFKKLPIIKKPGLMGIGSYMAHSHKFDTRIHSFWFNLTIVF
jgi:hypothetical protein